MAKLKTLRYGAAASLLVITTLIQPAERQSGPVLVELFTSEGCSSCPPADRLLESLDQNPNLIVLSEHVDYWNQQGWRDPYSSKAATDRQSDYGERFHLESVYTPQVVIDGRAEASGNDRGVVAEAINKAGSVVKTPVQLVDVRREGGRIHLRVSAPDAKAHSTVYVAFAEDRTQSSVNAGENSGKTLGHVAVVRKLQALKPAELDKPVTLPLGWQPKAGVRVIAFVQERGTGTVLGAARFPGLL
jgi:hypothetical protein